MADAAVCTASLIVGRQLSQNDVMRHVVLSLVVVGYYSSADFNKGSKTDSETDMYSGIARNSQWRVFRVKAEIEALTGVGRGCRHVNRGRDLGPIIFLLFGVKFEFS